MIGVIINLIFIDGATGYGSGSMYDWKKSANCWFKAVDTGDNGWFKIVGKHGTCLDSWGN